MKKNLTTALAFLFFTLLIINSTFSQENRKQFTLENPKITFSVFIEDDKLVAEEIVSKPGCFMNYPDERFQIKTDGNFQLDIFWSHWRAPGKANNADNRLLLDKRDFKLTDVRSEKKDNTQLLVLHLKSKTTLEARVIYSLSSNSFYVNKKVTVRDSIYGAHFLHGLRTLNYVITDENSEIIKAGGFGQPAVVANDKAAAFFGLAYPTATNKANKTDGKRIQISTNQLYGEQISGDWMSTEAAVLGIAPKEEVYYQFMQYVKAIRVAPARPYTLYNSWYDLRAVDYPRPIPEEHIMNEENIFRMIRLLREEMIEKHDIQLDAFVLDDGWDVYESDWQLRTEQFPNGMKSIAKKLEESQTDLGIWFGPTGGYSSRMRRINWMKEHGYEANANEYRYNSAYLCLAGENYSRLFKKRITDFVANDKASYFKWDGIQFSCSDPTHGHPTGLYSRRAVMESVIDKCDTVRAINPDVYLNITSGTWLSPWWVQYANQIWMDGGDYGYADVPSYSRRDAAITYRDFVLYDDFKNKDLWFPISNLMTHGIIKGNLQMLGGAEEPIDKFTDNALLYFARGVSMYEFYISPLLLTEAEWEALAQSLHWAKANFDILSNTQMIGGNPTRGESYGYAHFKGDEGIVAVRNPNIDQKCIDFLLDHNNGLNIRADSLVVERIYPNRWIAPKLYAAGDNVHVCLPSYETAVYKIYPLEKTKEALPANILFSKNGENETTRYTFYEKTGKPLLLNQENLDGEELNAFTTALDQAPEIDRKLVTYWKVDKKTSNKIDLEFSQIEEYSSLQLGVLINPEDANAITPALKIKHKNESHTPKLNGEELPEKERMPKGERLWYTLSLQKGMQKLELQFEKMEEQGWNGKVEIYLIGNKQMEGKVIKTNAKAWKEEVMPPLPYPADKIKVHQKIGNVVLKIL